MGIKRGFYKQLLRTVFAASVTLLLGTAALAQEGEPAFADAMQITESAAVCQDINIFKEKASDFTTGETRQGAYTWKSQNLTITVKDGILTVSGNGAMADYDYDQAPWMDYQYDEVMNTVKKIVVENGVTRIGAFAFEESSAREIVLPSTLTSIGEYAFFGAKIESVALPDSLKSLAAFSFSFCDSLKKVVFGQGPISLGSYTFRDCYNLTEVVLPKKLSVIEDYAFYNCRNLKNVAVSSSVKRISGLAFYGSPALSLKLPSGLKKMADGSYAAVSTIKTVQGKMDYTQAYEVLRLVNKERAKEGLSALTMDRELLEAAMHRAAETSVSFSHTRPNGMSCFSVSAKANGENIAMGQTSAAFVMSSWMASTGHRENILTAGYKSIGIGCYYRNSTYYWVQLFGGDAADKIEVSGTKTVKTEIAMDKDLYVAAPKLTGVVNAAKGVTVSWNKVKGAEKYRVFYRTGSSGWKSAGNTASNKFTVTGLTSGKAYRFTVRCISADGLTYMSSYDKNGKAITYVAAPKLARVANASKGVTVKWNKVAGAGKYRVFYKTGSGKWIKAGDTTSNSYTVKTGLKSGKKYTFTVRCMNKNATSYTSSFDAAGKSIVYKPKTK